MHSASKNLFKKGLVAISVTSLLTITACSSSDSDPAAPINGPLSIVMASDTDSDAGELAGVLTISPSADESDIAEYNLYWGTEECEKVSSEAIASLAVTGENIEHTFAENTDIPDGADKLLVFSSNAGGEMATCMDMDISDDGFTELTIQAAGLAFTDTDDSPGEVSGTVTITLASNESTITGYALYWGSDADTRISQIGDDHAKTGSNITPTIAADTAVPAGATHILVYTYSGAGTSKQLSNNPVAAVIVEVDAPTVNSGALTFSDDDTDGGEISGDLGIPLPGDETTITHYNVYWGESTSAKLSETAIASIAKTGSALTHTFAADTVVPAGATHLLVRTMNDHGEDSDGTSVAINDDGLPTENAASVTFTDTDLDGGEIAGTVTVGAASSETSITHYVLYWADASDNRLFDMAITSVPTSSGSDVTYTFPANSMVPTGATKIAVYTKNDGGEKLDGITSSTIDDQAVPVNAAASVAFDDTDLVGTDEVGGTVAITAASDESDLTNYVVYWGSSATEKLSGQSAIGTVAKANVASGQAISADTAIPTDATHILVFTENADGEMATGVSVAIDDKLAPVNLATSPTWSDTGSTANSVEGTLSFTAASSEEDLDSYVIYWGTSTTAKLGDGGSGDAAAIAEINKGETLEYEFGTTAGTGGTDNRAVPTTPSTPTHFLIFSKNADGENPTPLAVLIDDQ